MEKSTSRRDILSSRRDVQSSFSTTLDEHRIPIDPIDGIRDIQLEHIASHRVLRRNNLYEEATNSAQKGQRVIPDSSVHEILSESLLEFLKFSM